VLVPTSGANTPSARRRSAWRSLVVRSTSLDDTPVNEKWVWEWFITTCPSVAIRRTWSGWASANSPVIPNDAWTRFAERVSSTRLVYPRSLPASRVSAMTCESVGIRRTAVERLVVGGVVGAVVEAGGVGGRAVAVGGELVDGGVLGGPAVVSVVVGLVVGTVVECDVQVGAATDEVVGFDDEGLGTDVPALSLSVLQAISATASVAAPTSLATVPEDRAAPLTTEP
jgi:hypothetical protein